MEGRRLLPQVVVKEGEGTGKARTQVVEGRYGESAQKLLEEPMNGSERFRPRQ